MERSGDQLLKSASTLLKLLGLVVSASVPVLLPSALIPSQLVSLSAAGSLLGTVAFLLAVNFADFARRYCKGFILTATVAALCALVLNLRFVVNLEVGETGKTTAYLIGWGFSRQGIQMLRTANVENRTIVEQLSRIGPDQIPTLFGATYKITFWLYTVAFLVLVFSAIFALVGTPTEVVRVEEGNSRDPA